MLNEFFNKLTERERFIVIFGSIFIVTFFIFAVVYRVTDYRNSISEEAQETREQFSQLEKMVKDYNYYKSLKSGDGEEVSKLYNKLNVILLRHQLKDKVSSMKDYKNIIQKEYEKLTIEVSFHSVPLNNVMKMIYDIEIQKQMNSRVEHFTFKRPLAGKELFDVTIRLSSYTRLKKDA